jgi:hypothetical protein
MSLKDSSLPVFSTDAPDFHFPSSQMSPHLYFDIVEQADQGTIFSDQQPQQEDSRIH